MVDELEQSWTTVHKEYCQNRGQKKPAGKNPSREKTQQEIWVESMAHAPKSSSYEGYTTRRLQPAITKHLFQQSMVNSKQTNKTPVTITGIRKCTHNLSELH